jgi:RNA polymerase sigma factor (sigma-70 family)
VSSTDPRRFDWLARPRARDEDAPLSAEARFFDALAQLPAAERSALALSELGGLEPDEIAQRLGTDRETAERLVSRARATVRAASRGAVADL